VNGDEVREVSFHSGGYDASQVDDLLRRIAAELDAGRPVGPLIANAAFRRVRVGQAGYETDAVDWFLYQLLRQEDHHELTRMGADPWSDLPVGNYFTASGPSGRADRTVAPSWRAVWKYEARNRKYLAQECANAWRAFGQEPGAHLRWVRAGAARHELRTAEQQAIALIRSGRTAAASTGGRTFTWKRVTASVRPDIDEIIRRSCRCGPVHLLDAATPRSRKRQAEASSQKPSRAVHVHLNLREFLDEAGMPILYTSGMNYDLSAEACITFPDQRWLRFPVRGTRRANAIMTAVDQAGNKVARYRIIRPNFLPSGPVEIIVHPDWKLTDELALAVVISAPWLSSYFARPRGGGG
jgi:DivIVA domain-containing protein